MEGKSKIEIRPMFHFTRKRIEANICICFVALKVYKELERMLKVSEIKMSVDKVLALAKTITTIQIKLPLNKEVYTQTMLITDTTPTTKKPIRHGSASAIPSSIFWSYKALHSRKCTRIVLTTLCGESTRSPRP